MEQWVKDQVKKQRESGEKGIEIKKQLLCLQVDDLLVWEKLYMKGLSPNLNPKKLSAVLKEAGLDRGGQNGMVYRR